MYCRCGNKIEQQYFKYNDYCKKCNIEIIECLNEFKAIDLTQHNSIPKSRKKDKEGV